MPVTRRSLIVTAGAAAAAAGLPASRLEAADAAPPLPAPFPSSVFRERQEKLRAAARARGMDAVFVMPSTNLAYAANLDIFRSERLTALLLFADGPAVLVTPNFEEANHRREAVIDDVKPWKEDQDPIALTAKLLEGKSVLGVEGMTPYETVVKLTAAFPGKIEDATSLFDGLRRIKSPGEQAHDPRGGRAHHPGDRRDAAPDPQGNDGEAGLQHAQPRSSPGSASRAAASSSSARPPHSPTGRPRPAPCRRGTSC